MLAKPYDNSKNQKLLSKSTLVLVTMFQYSSNTFCLVSLQCGDSEEGPHLYGPCSQLGPEGHEDYGRAELLVAVVQSNKVHLVYTTTVLKYYFEASFYFNGPFLIFNTFTSAPRYCIFIDCNFSENL